MSSINIRKINFWKLKLFCESYITHSFTTAAENLNISQPVVSKAIADIEDLMGGVELFVKIGNNVYPTKEADTLFLKVESILDNIEKVFITEHKEEIKKISIAATHSVCCTLIPAALKEFKTKNMCGDIESSIYNTDRSNALSLLRRKIVDFALFPAAEVPKTFHVVHEVELDPALLVHNSNPILHKKNITAQDIMNEKLIMIDDYKISENYRKMFGEIYEKQKIKIHNADWEMIMRFVSYDHGSCLFCDVPIEDKNISTINLKGILPQVRYFVIANQKEGDYTTNSFVESIKHVLQFRESCKL